MDIYIAEQADLDGLARLLWLNAQAKQQASQSIEKFAVDLGVWWTAHSGTHFPFVARLGDEGLVGMAWLAIVPRVPRPRLLGRMSADIQSVFVVPEQRGSGIGSTLVRAATDHGFRLGAGRVTVSSGSKAVPVYERLGFAASRQLLKKELT